MELSDDQKKEILKTLGINPNHNNWAKYEEISTKQWVMENLSDVPFVGPGDDIFARKDVIV
jgi:hypothetical protein